MFVSFLSKYFLKKLPKYFKDLIKMLKEIQMCLLTFHTRAMMAQVDLRPHTVNVLSGKWYTMRAYYILVQ